MTVGPASGAMNHWVPVIDDRSVSFAETEVPPKLVTDDASVHLTPAVIVSVTAAVVDTAPVVSDSVKAFAVAVVKATRGRGAP